MIQHVPLTLPGVITARSKLRKVLFLALSVTFLVFLFVYEISREPLNGFAPNSQGRRVSSLARTSLNVKVKGQGHQGQKHAVHSHHPLIATAWNALSANNVMQQQTGPFRRCRG